MIFVYLMNLIYDSILTEGYMKCSHSLDSSYIGYFVKNGWVDRQHNCLSQSNLNSLR